MKRIHLLMPQLQISREKLRREIRKLDGASLFVMLDRAIDLMPEPLLARLAQGYISPSRLGPDDSEPAGLVESVQAFHDACLSGSYYEDFDVNWRNCTQQSRGTQLWMAECRRLLDRIFEAVAEGEWIQACRSFELLFDLWRKVDHGTHDIIFIADDGGVWEVGFDWNEVLPAWFRCLASSADPDEYVDRTTDIIDTFVYGQRESYLRKAHAAATPSQQEAQNDFESPG